MYYSTGELINILVIGYLLCSEMEVLVLNPDDQVLIES